LDVSLGECADFSGLDKTPLEVAKIPVMDAIAKSGICGLHDPVQAGLACGSDTAHMQIFGYNPLKLYK
jgi:2,3-bisphosphoglycerate-independent phosphoglycerate mutase